MDRSQIGYWIMDHTPELRSRRDLDEAIINPDRCHDLVAWVMDSGRLSEYTLARNLGANRVTTGPDKGNNDGSDGNSETDITCRRVSLCEELGYKALIQAQSRSLFLVRLASICRISASVSGVLADNFVSPPYLQLSGYQTISSQQCLNNQSVLFLSSTRLQHGLRRPSSLYRLALIRINDQFSL